MMTIARRFTTMGAGLLAGLVASLTMGLLMIAGRYWLGISPPPEAGPDRFAPLLSIRTFFNLFGQYGGYNGLKQFGIKSGIEGMLAVGLAIGFVYALLVESRRGRASVLVRGGLSRISIISVASITLVLWLATVIALWPVLDANYRGLPPTWARPTTILALLVYYVIGYGVTLVVTYRFLVRRAVKAVPPATRVPPEPSSSFVGQPIGRRAVIAGIAGAILAMPSFILMRRLYNQAVFSYDGRPYSGPGIQPITPNDKFYSVTKNVVDPTVNTAVWRLEVNGLVDHPLRLSFDDLQGFKSVTQETTLMCISNHIGAGLFSNAVWQGVPMRDILMKAGVGDNAAEVKLHGVDSYTDTFGIEKALDPATLVAFRMNDQEIPQRHGGPVRIIVPGYFGEKNVKWVTRIEVVDHDAHGFYEQQGWGPDFMVPTRSDIFAPRWTRGRQDNFVDTFHVNQAVTIRGRAFAGDRGVSKIEVSMDGGETWRTPRIDYRGTKLTWTFWSYVWRPSAAGNYVITSRAVDGDGNPQPTGHISIIPQGARDYHTVHAKVV